MPCQIKQDLEFLRRQPDFLTFDMNTMVLCVNAEVPDFDDIRLGLLLQSRAP